jgi:uncharacterized protein (TIGR03437 family)
MRNYLRRYVYIAATHADGSLLGPAGLIKTATTTPAAPRETIVLYGTGFGQTAATPTIVIDGIAANVAFAGMSGPGLYQFNVVVPTTVSTGDVLVAALMGNGETQSNGSSPWPASSQKRSPAILLTF